MRIPCYIQKRRSQRKLFVRKKVIRFQWFLKLIQMKSCQVGKDQNVDPNPLGISKRETQCFSKKKNKKGTIRGYGVFRGLVEFKSESHFRKLVDEHGVKCTLKDSGFKFGWRFSSPHEYEKMIMVDSRGQQRKSIGAICNE